MTKPKAETPLDILIDGLDRGAKVLLDAAFPVTSSDTDPPKDGNVPGGIPLADQIKAFTAVLNYAGERPKLVAPGERVTGKGERLRDKFQRATLGRGNGAAQAEDTSGTD
jgi:hypothetical protein